MTLMKNAILTLALILILNACTSIKPATWTQESEPEQPFSSQGRVSGKMDKKGFFAFFEFDSKDQAYTLSINTPLGNTVGQLCQDNAGFIAKDNKGRVFQAQNLEEISEKFSTLAALPLNALSRWVLGQYLNTHPHNITKEGTLQQLGWEIERDTTEDGQPSRLTLTQEPLRLKLIFQTFDAIRTDNKDASCALRNEI